MRVKKIEGKRITTWGRLKGGVNFWKRDEWKGNSGVGGIK